MGAVDLVIQVEIADRASRAACSGSVGPATRSASRRKGVIFPKYRGDLLEAAVVTERMHEGAIETTTIPRNPLDVLAQQIVAMTVMDRWTVDDLLATVTRAAPFETLTRELLEGVLGMLAGAYPSDEFAGAQAARRLGPRDRRRRGPARRPGRGGHLRRHDPRPRPVRRLPGRRGRHARPARRRARRGDGLRVGPGCTATSSCSAPAAGASTRSRHDRVMVSPAPGEPGKLPFWKGDAVGRPIELGRAMGAFVGELEADLAHGDARPTGGRRRGCASTHDLDELRGREPARLPRGRARGDRRAAHRQADRRRALPRRAGRLAAVPADAVRRPRPRAVGAGDRGRLRERLGLEVQTIWSDDGIAIRLPEGDAPLDGIEALLFPEPDEVEDLVVGQVGVVGAVRQPVPRERGPGAAAAAPAARGRGRRSGSSASVRRTCSPWRAGTAASRSSSRRTASACRDVFDLPALREVLGGVARREIAVHSVETRRATPFASILLFDYIAAYMYEGDAPAGRAPRRALALDRDLLRELLGPGGAARAARSRCARRPRAGAPGARRGPARDEPRPASTTCCAAWATWPPTRSRPGPRAVPASPEPWLDELALGPAGRPDPDRRRGALDRDRGRGALPRRRRRAAPVGVPEAFLAPAAGALDGLLARWARTTGRSCARAGPPLGAAGRRRRGRPGAAAGRRARCSAASSGPAARSASGATPRSCGCSGAGRWRACGARSSRSSRPRWPASCPPGTASRPVGECRRPPFRGTAALERLAEVVDQLAGLPIPASVLERDVLPARVPGYQPRLLDELGRAGRGGLGRAGEPRPRRRPGRALPARPRGAAPGRARRPGSSGRPGRATRPSASTWRAAGPRSTASCTRPRAAARTARCSTRCGTWSGRARSPTTRSRRCGRCAGSGPASGGPAAARPAASRLGPPEAAGRWSLVEPAGGAQRHGASPRPAPWPCSSATGC